MNVWKKASTKRLVALLLTVLLAVGCLPWAGAESCFEGQACNQGLLPEDHHFKDGVRINDGDGEIVLHKTAERIGPDEWNVTVRATINEEVQRPKQKLELVILMDTSGSMAWCTHQEEHDLGDHRTHNASCYRYSCGWAVNHSHSSSCYGNCILEAHTHNDACYQLNCTQELHTHSVANGCYRICTNWQHYYCECQNIEGQRRILTCKNTHQSHSVSNGCYELACPKAEHTHSNNYNSTCVKELVCTLHVHTNDCEQELICTRQLIDHSTNGATFCKYAGTNQNLDSRLAVAKEKLLSLIENLKDTNKGYDVTVRFCSFSSNFTNHNNNQTINSIRQKINGVSANGGTNMYTAIPSAIDKFQVTDAKQVFLLMTDGAASDGGGAEEDNAITKLNTFKNGGGTVFTVGFAYHNDDLAQIAGGGGSYVHAGSELELEKALLNIENIIHAMMVDPMGKKVGFDAGSIQLSESNVEGTVSYVGDTLYWNPTDGTVPGGAEIEYTYNVKLNSLADMEVGRHSRVELNDPTDLVYNITSSGTTTQYSANFPIPEAEYQVATIKQRWVNQNGTLKDDSEVESIISDYSDEEYTPQFVTDYQNPVKSITNYYNNKYVYTGSTATKNGDPISLDEIDPSQAAAYVVTHNYSYADNTRTVSYQYTGNVPADAPEASANNHYAKPDSPVDVAVNPTADGFSFSGWHAVSGITDSQISNGSFTMPNRNVVFEGSWTKLRGYRVQANYFVNINGLRTEQENLQVVDLGFITTADESTSYDFSDAFAYDGKKYTTVTLAEGSVGTGITGNLVVGIEPGLDSTPVVTLNFYRNEDRSYTLFVKHVFDDGSTHEGYADKYEPYGNPYTYNQSWSVEGIAVPEGYARVMSTSGVTDGSNADTLIEQGQGVLKGDAFGNANKYVVIHYQKAPCYIVEADYYLVVDGETPIKENVDAPVRLAFVTCETSDEHTYTIQPEDRKYTVYTNAELKEDSVGTLNEERTAVSGIIPATDTYPVVHLNFYRYETTSVPYQVFHEYYVVGPDGTVIGEKEECQELSGLSGNHGQTVAIEQNEEGTHLVVAKDLDGKSGAYTYTFDKAEPESLTLDKTSEETQTITLEYVRHQYSVTITGDEGVAKVTNGLTDETATEQTPVDGATDVSLEKTYDAGSDVTVTYALKAGYQLDSVTVQGDEDAQIIYSYTEDENTVTISNLQANATVEVKTKKQHNLYVKYVFTNGSTHEGYPSEYQLLNANKTYVAGDAWIVTPIAAPDDYRLVNDQTGEEANGAVVAGKLNGIFGDADTYVVITYEHKPAYIVEADYYLVVDDEAPIKENVDAPVRLAFVTCETSDEHTYTIQHEDRKYTVGDTEQSYTNAELKEDSVGTLNEERTAVSGINPATDTYPVVHLNFYRNVTTSVPYRVAHKYYTVAPDGTTRTEVTADALLISQNGDGTLLTGIHNQTVGVATDDVQPDIKVAPIPQGQQTKDQYTLVSDITKPMTLDKTSKETQTITLEYVRHQYRVTITGDEGIAEVTNGLTGGTAAVQTATEGEAAVSLEKTYDAGSDVTVTYDIKPGYQLKSVTVANVDGKTEPVLAYEEGENSVSISNLNANANVQVVTEKVPYHLYVKYVFSDGTNHDADGYPSDFEEQSTTYYTGDSWSVTPDKQVLDQYTFVATKSGEVPGADAVDVNGELSGTFGAGDVYAVVYYQLLPSYHVEIHYFTNKNGNGYQQDGSNEVVKLTYTAAETVEVNFASHLAYKEKVYASPQMDKNEHAQFDADANKVSIQPQLITNGVVVNVYRVENDAATYQVDHKYTVIGPDGNPFGEPVIVTGEIITGAHGDSIDSFTSVPVHDEYPYVQTNSPAGIVLDAKEHKTVTLEYVRHLYSVTYQWEGTEQPDDVELPEEAIYSPDASVNVAEKPSVKGWSFDGWHVQSGLTESIDDGSFTMPNNNVVLVGSWTKQPAYIVQADYYLVEDGEEKQENEKTVQLALVYCEDDTETSYTITDANHKYTVGNTEQSYPNAELKEGSVGTLNEERTAVSGITPATDTYPVVHLNFYRHVTTSVPYRVAHKYYTVAADGTTRTEVTADALLISQNEDGTLLTGIHNQTVGVATDDVQPDIEVAPITQGQQTYDQYTLVSVTTNPMTLDKDSEEIQTITLEYERHQYNVTITGDEGIAKVTNGLTDGTATEQTPVDGATDVSLEKTYDAGSDVTVTYDIKPGYQLNSVTVANVDGKTEPVLAYEEGENSVSISNLNANANVQVVTKKVPYHLYVKYVFSDGTNHDADGYLSHFEEQSTTYYTGDSWSVTPDEQVLDQYTFVATKSGEVSGADAVDVNSKLSGTFGAGDVYAVVYYQLLPSYCVEINYFTNKNGNGYQQDGSDKVVGLTYTAAETVEVNFASYLTYEEKVYASPQMVENEYAQLDADANKVSVQPQLTTNHVVVKVYRVENDAATYQVDHKYTVIGPDGNPLGEPVTVTGEIITGAHGDFIDSFTPVLEYGEYPYVQTNNPAGIVLDAKEHKTVTLEYVRHLYSVTYQWEGTEHPDGVELPEEAIYSPDAFVNVAEKPSAEGWSFDGWRVQSGLTESIDDGSFTMPNNNVVLVGSWAEIPTYSVTYEYDETAPEGAPAVPVDEEKYYAGKQAEVMPKPSMEGYTFTGWTPKTEGVTITKNTFTMPAQNVVLVGTWAKQPSYQITVKYYTITDGVVPDTCDETFTSEVFYRKDTADVGTYTYSATAPESRIGYTDDAELSEAGSGATLNATAQQLTGIVPAEDTAQVLVKLYRKVNKAYTATVRYHDANGNSLSSDVTSAPIVFGQTYDLTDLALSVIEVETAEGKKLYRFDHDDCTYKGTLYKGIMPANSFTITRVYVEMDTAVAVVRYVDENGQPLREDLMSAPVYIGEPYNVSEAKAVDVIVQGNKEYQFKYHYQQRELVRSMGGLMAMNGDEYAGPMPVGGVIITRVYELSNETYYYQQKYVFTAYDANGDVVYSASEEWPVASTDQETVTITAPETYSHEGYGFNRKSEETQSAGLAGTTAERPHVFVVEYEMHEGDEPVPDTQLPPGLTPPQEPPKATDAPVADLPPQTGDDGVALYLVLMLCAAAGLAALIADHRKRCH